MENQEHINGGNTLSRIFLFTESISYEFGPGTGLVTFTFPPNKQPDTKADLVALGFITMADNGVLARIDSGTSNDYMELEIVSVFPLSFSFSSGNLN